MPPNADAGQAFIEPEKSHEQRGAHDVNALIASYEQFIEFRKMFAQLEAGEIQQTGSLTSPWNVIAHRVSSDRELVSALMHEEGELAADDLGRKLFEAKVKRHDNPPNGSVRAYSEGSCLVLLFSDVEDLYAASGLSPEKSKITAGAYKRGSFRLEVNSTRYTASQVPLILVLDEGPEKTEFTKRHEHNHYRMSLYHTERQLQNVSDGQKALEAVRMNILTLNDGTSSEHFLDSLRHYASLMEYEAISESACEMMATGRIDSRSSYPEEYFLPLTEAKGVTDESAHLIEQVKEEFIKNMDDIQARIGRIVESFYRLEHDQELAMGTIVMRILSSDPASLRQTIEEMEIILKIDMTSDYYDLKFEITSLKDEPIRIPGAQDIYAEINRLLEENTEEANRVHGGAGYGYKQAREEGKSIPEAFRTAVAARATYMAKVKPIRERVTAIRSRISRPKQ